LATSTESICSKGKSKSKAIMTHKRSNIDYLTDFRFGMNLKKKDSKITADCIVSLNKDLKALEEVEENEIKEIESKRNKYLNRKEGVRQIKNKSKLYKCLSLLMEREDLFV
jgi:hypothetical protein